MASTRSLVTTLLMMFLTFMTVRLFFSAVSSRKRSRSVSGGGGFRGLRLFPFFRRSSRGRLRGGLSAGAALAASALSRRHRAPSSFSIISSLLTSSNCEASGSQMTKSELSSNSGRSGGSVCSPGTQDAILDWSTDREASAVSSPVESVPWDTD
uniref:Uncharacterized protein n=1 Tax=Ixodes ricinus TaxID=34613 RepID=A0A6B0UW36_IXORI